MKEINNNFCVLKPNQEYYFKQFLHISAKMVEILGENSGKCE